MALADAVPFAKANWTLNESSGTRNDSVGSNHLSETGTVSASSGKFDSAAGMGGNNANYLSVADTADLSFGNESFCITFWFYITSVTDRELIIKKSTAGGSSAGYRAGLYNSGGAKIFWAVANGSDNAEATSGAISTGTWHLAVVYHNASTDKIGVSIDGGTPAETSYAWGCADESNAFTLARGHDGWIDDVTVLDGYVLSSTEITELWNGGTGVAFASWAGAATGHPAMRHLGLVAGCRPVEIGREGTYIF